MVLEMKLGPWHLGIRQSNSLVQESTGMSQAAAGGAGAGRGVWRAVRGAMQALSPRDTIAGYHSTIVIVGGNSIIDLSKEFKLPYIPILVFVHPKFKKESTRFILTFNTNNFRPACFKR